MTAPALAEHLPTQLAHELKGHEGAVLNVRFNTQGTYCLTCGKVRPWDQRQQPHLQQEEATQHTTMDERCAAVKRLNSEIVLGQAQQQHHLHGTSGL
jgi:hypothetical protein